MIVFAFIGVLSFRNSGYADSLTGAWELKMGNDDHVLMFMDGYFTYTVFDKSGRRFVRTCGGTYSFQKDGLQVQYEFDTRDKEIVGKTAAFTADITDNSMKFNITGKEARWTRTDKGTAPLSGLWAITARKQNGELQAIHQRGTRKTVKILTGTRFQWAAIDPGTKEFMGTGGGTYTFADGKYTEKIEFFSRDSSRVGGSLTFDGKLEAGDWHHSGLSSKGDPIYEVWSRKK